MDVIFGTRTVGNHDYWWWLEPDSGESNLYFCFRSSPDIWPGQLHSWGPGYSDVYFVIRLKPWCSSILGLHLGPPCLWMNQSWVREGGIICWGNGNLKVQGLNACSHQSMCRGGYWHRRHVLQHAYWSLCLLSFWEELMGFYSCSVIFFLFFWSCYIYFNLQNKLMRLEMEMRIFSALSL